MCDYTVNMMKRDDSMMSGCVNEVSYIDPDVSTHIIETMTLSVKIRKAGDGRGWYICDRLTGTCYLHSDYIVYHGVRGDHAFWPTRSGAVCFWNIWRRI